MVKANYGKQGDGEDVVAPWRCSGWSMVAGRVVDRVVMALVGGGCSLAAGSVREMSRSRMEVVRQW